MAKIPKPHLVSVAQCCSRSANAPIEFPGKMTIIQHLRCSERQDKLTEIYWNRLTLLRKEPCEGNFCNGLETFPSIGKEIEIEFDMDLGSLKSTLLCKLFDNQVRSKTLGKSILYNYFAKTIVILVKLLQCKDVICMKLVVLHGAYN